MRNSGHFQLGTITILTATIVAGGLSAAFIFPMLKQGRLPHTRSAADSSPDSTVAAITRSQRFAEFYPASEDKPQPVRQSQVRPHAPYVETQTGPYRAASHSPRPRREDVPTRDVVAYDTSSLTAEREFYPPQNDPRVSAIPETHSRPRPVHRDAAPQGTADFASDEPRGIRSETSQTPPPAGPVPTNLPPGSVYAPVTVNLDAGSFASQMSELEDRLTAALDAREVQQNENSPKDRSRRNRKNTDRSRKVVDNSESEEKLKRTEAELRELVDSFRSLQQRTDARLDELTIAAERANVAQQLMESYRRVLQSQERQAVRQMTAAENTINEFATPTFVKEEFVPQPAEFVADEELTTEPFGPGSFFEGEIPADVQQPAAPEPVAQPAVVNPPASTPGVVSVDEAISQPPQPVTGPLPPVNESLPGVDSFELSSAPTTSGTLNVPSNPVVATPVILSADNPPAAQPLPAVTVEPAPTEPAPIKMFPVKEMNVAPEATPTNETTSPETVAPPQVNRLSAPQPLSTELSDSSLNPVPPMKDSHVTTPSVGFEHVYRFKLETVDNEQKVVVNNSGPVCPVCGKVHASDIHQVAAVKPVASTAAASVKTASKPATSSVVHRPTAGHGSNAAQIKTPKPAKTGARGTNRHVNAADGEQRKGGGLFPSLGKRVATGSNTDSGILHRLSSAVRRIGNPVIKSAD